MQATKLHVPIRLGACMLVFASMVGLSTPRADACTCAGRPSVDEMLARSEHVFAGRVIDVFDAKATARIHSGADPIEYTFRVLARWKGRIDDTIRVTSVRSEATCGYTFEDGEDYLVFTHERDGRHWTGLCGRNRSLHAAEEELVALPPPAYVIDGFALPTTTVESLAAALELTDTETVARTLRALGSLGPAAASALPSMLALLDRDPWLVRAAITAALKVDPGHAHVTPACHRLDHGDDHAARAAMLDVLWREQLAQEFGLPSAEHAFEHDAAPVREAAVRYLLYVGRSRGTTRPIADAGIRDEDARVRRATLSSITSLGLWPGLGDSTMVAMVEATRTDENEAVRQASFECFRHIVYRAQKSPDFPDPVPLLVRFLNDSSLAIRRTALLLLARLVEKDRAAPELLCDACRRGSDWERRWCYQWQSRHELTCD